MREREVEVLLRFERGAGIGGGGGGRLRNDGVEIIGQKAIPNGVGISGGSESGGNEREPADIERRSEGENVSDATFRKVLKHHHGAEFDNHE